MNKKVAETIEDAVKAKRLYKLNATQAILDEWAETTQIRMETRYKYLYLMPLGSWSIYIERGYKDILYVPCGCEFGRSEKGVELSENSMTDDNDPDVNKIIGYILRNLPADINNYYKNMQKQI